MVKIRMRRMGARNHPFFRVVVSDTRQTPTAAALEEIGYYDSRKQPAIVNINRERYDHWVSKGAQVSDSVRTLVAKA